jgi:hypothetical protein
MPGREQRDRLPAWGSRRDDDACAGRGRRTASATSTAPTYSATPTAPAESAEVGAIADNIPARDLYVSPEHAMFLDGVLVPAGHLVKGVSIVKIEGMEEVDYFHLEFDRHVVIFADLEAAGIGDGRHAFSFVLPKGLTSDIDHRIEVRREIDWSLLGGAQIALAARSA